MVSLEFSTSLSQHLSAFLSYPSFICLPALPPTFSPVFCFFTSSVLLFFLSSSLVLQPFSYCSRNLHVNRYTLALVYGLISTGSSVSSTNTYRRRRGGGGGKADSQAFSLLYSDISPSSSSSVHFSFSPATSCSLTLIQRGTKYFF